MTTIACADRGFAYGDGVFETLRLYQGQPEWWFEHVARLHRGCRQLALPRPAAAALRARIAAAVDAHPVGEWGVLKLTYTAGMGTRGYRRPESVQPTIAIQCGPMPPQIDRWRKNGLVVDIQSQGFAGVSHLIGLKHLNRLPQVLARMACPETVDECLMADSAGCLVGGIQSNFFWFEDGQWYTPPVSGAGIAGTIRALLITHLGIRRAPLAIGRLALARAAVMTNAVWGIVPVRTLQGRSLDRQPAQALAAEFGVIARQRALAPDEVGASAWLSVAHEERMMNGDRFQ